MTSVISLATSFYKLNSGHVPIETYLKRFSHWEDNKCWWCWSGTLQMRKHLFRYCSQWDNRQTALWNTVGQATWWKVSRSWHVRILEHCSIKKCDQTVIDVLAATDVGKFLPKLHQQNVFQSLEDSRSVWQDAECKLRSVNFRRVSDPRRAFRPAFRVTGISDNW